MQIERRRDPRVPFYAEVQVVGRDESYFHPANNLSMGGVFLKTEFPLPVGTLVNLHLPTIPSEGDVLVPGMVAWCQAGARPGTPEALADPPILPGMGIKFRNLEDGLRGKLHQLISRPQKLK